MRAAIALLSVALAACTSTPTANRHVPPGDEQRYTRDQHECRLASVEIRDRGYGQRDFLNHSLFITCMESRGWSRQ